METLFREDELTVVQGVAYPKISGRLRLAHEKNDSVSISTEIIQFDEKVAVVKAVCQTNKGCFDGIGMASVERDKEIAPALLELAETRGVARSLHFAGYGLDCGAEEVSHINSNGFEAYLQKTPVKISAPTSFTPPHENKGGNGDGNRRLTAKQHKYILKLMGSKWSSKSEMDDYCVQLYGASLQHLSREDASNLIETLVEK